MFSPEFGALGLQSELLAALYELDYHHPSPIQQQSIPLLLEGRNLLGTAQTGTGKTAAYALPLLQRLTPAQPTPQVLVLTPTRELAIQVAQAIESFARHLKRVRILAVYGGSSYGPQLKGLTSGVDIVVGTPGRLIDHLERGTLKLGQLQALVLDEADEMLRMGFIEDVERLLAAAPESCQRVLFSATMPPAIRRVAGTYLNDAEQVQIASPTTTLDQIEQRYLLLYGRQKTEALSRLLETEPIDGAMVFVRTKEATSEVASQLRANGFKAAALNGDLSQAQREECVAQLRQGQIDIVVATDVAARGLDVERISHVFNYDIPFDTEAYIHRIGRTGRAGRSGRAILFVTPQERRLLRGIEQVTRQTIALQTLPDAQQISEQRVATFSRRLQELLGTVPAMEKERLQSLVENFCQQHQIGLGELSAALAWAMQREKPLFAAHDKLVLPATESERAKRTRPERKAPEEPAGPMVSYRLSLGRQHKISPKDIVGALANEGQLPFAAIGRIRIHEQFCEIELAASVSPTQVRQLKKIRIRQHAIELEPLRQERRGKAAPHKTASRPVGKNATPGKPPRGSKGEKGASGKKMPAKPRPDGGKKSH